MAFPWSAIVHVCILNKFSVLKLSHSELRFFEYTYKLFYFIPEYLEVEEFLLPFSTNRILFKKNVEL